MTNNQKLWMSVARDRYPTLTENEVMGMSMKAASEYYLGGDKVLVELFEQYLILKTLSGDTNGK
jgi:hypothetical protein